MDDITRPEHLRSQYDTDDKLATRTSVWQPTDDGRDPSNEAFKAIDRAMTGDSDVLEVGCGTGAMAERIAALPGVTLVAIDWSDAFVELARARGVDARQGDVCYLPFEDDSFDVVYAGWMLYHVRDLDRALAEVRRVLRPGGTFVAVTNGDDHLGDLRRETGGRRMVLNFSSENGEFTLGRRFSDVRRQDLETRAVFVDREQAQAYLDTLDEGLVMPDFEGPRTYTGHVTVFEAR
ncbi:Methyltransferase domain-containing protein [Nocardioides exalbidus]|uniref:Methyltransferase domain-containing protein n=1 Tax=Nocardioides exalbidus TaxID=402596 RepID=A0A1H4K485_9ACTN|nr:class I SAM-dependent methyltransferase [Nocardioides exalbidus]SEB53207.1 Methyltransferase domain-containing protein [Nocardioides exalbidus]